MALDEFNSQRRQDREMAKEITALLGTDDLISMALKSWKDLVDEFEYDLVTQAHTDYNFVPGLVEVLFDLLPTLRAARRNHSSRLIRDETQTNSTNDLTFNSPATTVLMPPDPHQETYKDENEKESESSKLRQGFWTCVTSLLRKGATMLKDIP